MFLTRACSTSRPSAEMYAQKPISAPCLIVSAGYIWPRTYEGLPLPWSEVPCWVKTMRVSAFKTLLDRKKLALTESVEVDFSKCASPFSIIVLDMINVVRVGYWHGSLMQEDQQWEVEATTIAQVWEGNTPTRHRQGSKVGREVRPIPTGQNSAIYNSLGRRKLGWGANIPTAVS